jgi:aspartyl-tRNA(Asn)/glutamyl-tRNA(Gln) amidotransferase subunit A
MSAVDLAGAIAARRLSPVEVVSAILDRIETVNPRINAYVTLTADSALADAKLAEEAVIRGDELGPLHGVPVSIKDLVLTKGVRTTMGSRLMQDFVPDEDAVLVTRLKDAGAIVLGKTNTPEFGLKMLTDNLVFGVTRNPWNPERSPGGSSGGAAAAVASGLGPVASGSDGGGSIRIPSSCCGVFGIKPQFGRVPRYPIFHGGDVLTHEGPIARTVRDAAVMLDVMAGHHWGDIYSLKAPEVGFAKSLNGGVRGLRIAWSPDLGYAEADSQVLKICEQAAQQFSLMGANVEEAHPGFENPAPHHSALYVVDHVEAFSPFGLPDQIAADLDPLTATMLYVGAEMKATDYARAMFAKQDLAAEAGRFFQTYDILLTPTLALPPPPVEVPNPADFLNWLPFITVFNMTGQPAASVPAGWTDDGLPVGLQIVGRAHDEATVLRAAAAFEEACPWSHRRPPLD